MPGGATVSTAPESMVNLNSSMGYRCPVQPSSSMSPSSGSCNPRYLHPSLWQSHACLPLLKPAMNL
eukprot:15434475-Alexandrium_andersonii.AAC.1